MNEKLKKLVEEFNDIEKKIYSELEEKSEFFSKEGKKISFSFDQKSLFKKLKIGNFRYVISSTPMFILTAPVIYSMIIPAIILDIFTSFYQAICFPVYGITKAKRSDYIVIDRHKLPYLNMIQKINCIYCGYFNGLIGFVREVASRTEQFWCPIKHAMRVKGLHKRHFNFSKYGDVEDFQRRTKALREELAALKR